MLLEVKNLSVYYYTLSGVVKGAENVSFSLEEGEWITFVGESGSGKSTVAQAVMNLVPSPGRIVSGEVLFRGRDLVKMKPEELRSIRGKEITMVFQDPMTSLDPLRKVGDQIVEAMVVHGVPEDEARERAKDLFEKVNLPADRLDYYPHQLSGGQRQRVSIAIAMAFNPKLLIADEPTTALDVIVQDAIMDLLDNMKSEGTTIYFVTHDISLAAERSDRIAVMYAGKLVELGTVEQIVESPLHPYTKALLEAVPDLWKEGEVKAIPGYPPDLRNPPRGCRFHPRCPLARAGVCDSEEPELREVEKGHLVACHFPGGWKE
ncbi:dipeptide/oligopeptide/nickel ABC transporter ATP-binding protein [Thermococcus profundus]|uniref:Dipeptide/oligopeptide/nickel ABC transporter ATP-binding protein n=1 Tax=Thermococcus profundus TaxID=49899 RepID=A0A2Z2M7Q5_THEPR|nr:ABC transporter ATP-binding protein [Thermococcus profundus]ASJ02450.1 dipeptide/oligopeptide/nickel ABC transporter ATP-binding protein [Thermococcus profundus]